MSDNSKPTQNGLLSFEQWLDRTQAITDQATAGPWSFFADTRLDGMPVYRIGSNETGEDIGSVPRYRHSDDGEREAEFIAHARTALPQAVAALRAILGLHVKVVTDRHIAGPTAVCEPCSEDRMFAVWPCPTVTAITEALGEE